MTNFIFIRIKDRFIPVSFADIIYVLSSGHYVKMVTTKGIYLPYLRLKDVSERLPPEQFAQINRHTIVALHRISWFDLHTVMVDKTSFVFSDRYRQELEKRNCVLVWKRTVKEHPFTADKLVVKSSLS